MSYEVLFLVFCRVARRVVAGEFALVVRALFVRCSHTQFGILKFKI